MKLCCPLDYSVMTMKFNLLKCFFPKIVHLSQNVQKHITEVAPLFPNITKYNYFPQIHVADKM